ncbi:MULTISPECIES: hypothetical protein [Micrococcaceae]|uniref:DUF892 family protein n=1 Tax=Arthrobacter sedimenti TaxID=2694931 RepID=A0ABV8WPC2_9MICC|nr:MULTISPECIES: hypothetical protein [Micrococcaceae]TQJ58692.1 hypothetical protein FBY30_0927 [Arthrobacter sp. SLBN-83]WJH24836.1 hypothetical protein JCQ34_01575 [Pseudarthrobacter defluvii]
MKFGLVLEEMHRSENDLAHHLLTISERHKVDHEIYHLARDLARWSQQHVRDIAAMGKNYGLDLDPEPRGEMGLMETIREKGSEMVGRRPETGMLLLRDLRELYLKACGVSADWELLAQAAQGKKDKDLLALAEKCHPQTIRQMKWANGKLKESATQVLVS